MDYFYRRIDGSDIEQCWRFDDNEGVLLGISNAESGPGSYFSKEGNQTVWETIKLKTPWFNENPRPFIKLDIAARQ